MTPDEEKVDKLLSGPELKMVVQKLEAEIGSRSIGVFVAIVGEDARGHVWISIAPEAEAAVQGMSPAVAFLLSVRDGIDQRIMELRKQN